MYSLHLSAEQIEFRDTVRSFVEDEVKPVVLNANRLDAGDRALPMDVLDKASQMGLRTLALSEELGGVGADALTSAWSSRNWQQAMRTLPPYWRKPRRWQGRCSRR